MATNLTGSTIASTYDQLLHVDDGPAATEKTVYSGTGVATAVKIGTGSASVDNIQIDGNTVASTDTNGNIVLSPNGTGTVNISKAAITGGSISGITDLAIADGGTGASDATTARSNLGLGTIATQAANNVSITGGSITGVVFTGSFSGITSITSDGFYTSDAAAGLSLTGNDLLADGTDTNIDIDITPKGTGEVNIPKVDIDGGTIDGVTIGGTSAPTVTNLGSVATCDINGGTIDGTTIGGATPAGVKGTTVEATTSIGYPVGTGGTVTQLTSRTTGVTLNKITGAITLFAAALSGGHADEFTLTNSTIGANDVVMVSIKSGAAAATRKYYHTHVVATAAGSCVIAVGNVDNSSIPTVGTESPVLQFVVIKGAVA